MLKLQSKIEIKVLGYFIMNPHVKRYINDLAKILELDPANLHKKLKAMEGEGILSSEMDGKQKYYCLNRNYPLLKEVIKIYKAKYGLEVILAQKLKNLKGLKEAYIFGSYAESKLEEESDIDLLLIGEHSSIEAIKRIHKLQNTIEREINIVDLTEKEFEKKKREKNEFIISIFSGAVIKII
ncbi:nucleotidyltransferase domain-containing protein [Patescibacteria group bacterium]|nr:nucleotidyltransferase domain-containing protein [Patescibacteria group bacterium]